jgi:nitric oxide reductase NorQ protein
MYKIENSLPVGPSEGFVETPAVKKIIDRALLYLQAALPVHLTGPTGTGKTTLALQLANALNRPVMLMFGDEEYTTADLVGALRGYTRRSLRDHFIHSVLKAEEEVSERWVDNRLTIACKEGFTFIYDEFSRSRPETNNALLSVLEEGILVLPTSEAGYIKVHPDFRAIFTSNPHEYSGVHKTQESLLDRMTTIQVDYLDEKTEVAIVVARTGIARDVAAKIVGLLHDCRQEAALSRATSIRPAIMIGKILGQRGVRADKRHSLFVGACVDTLLSTIPDGKDRKEMTEKVISLIHKYF